MGVVLLLVLLLLHLLAAGVPSLIVFSCCSVGVDVIAIAVDFVHAAAVSPSSSVSVSLFVSATFL